MRVGHCQASFPKRPLRLTGAAFSFWGVVLLGLWIASSRPAYALDLGGAVTWQLGNGLTVVVVEEHASPVVSVQSLYRVGARTEENGRTGLAHFLEHMAFRATENFPGTGVTSSIYAVGGEWHGYTWIDQTTFFETVPAADLDLALRIEADRMARLVLAEADVEAERGAVLAELHGYENDLGSVLHDAVVATAFVQHPYRNNTIGWESDVTALRHEDIVDFYRRHYRPSNAVLAIAGDVDLRALRRRVGELFGPMPANPATPPPRTVEPRQAGERRILLEGAGAQNLLEIAYPAPAAGDGDFAPFLVLQEILAGGSGVNFRQSDATTAARGDSLLSVAASGVGDLRTWLAPAEFRYLFSIAGSAPDPLDAAAAEQAIERALAALRDREVNDQTLVAARKRVLEELVFDVETTEDAAHELAFYSGLNALSRRLALPASVVAVTPADVRRVAQRYLSPDQRTIGWYRSGTPPVSAGSDAPASGPATAPKPPTSVPRAHEVRGVVETPQVRTIAGGLPVIIARNPLTPAVYATVLLRGAWEATPGAEAASPVRGYTRIGGRALAGDGLATLLADLRAAMSQSRAAAASAPVSPEQALAQAIDDAVGLASTPPAAPAPARPALLVITGDLEPGRAFRLAEKSFGGSAVAVTAAPATATMKPADRRLRFDGPASQSQIAAVAAAPGPGTADALASQLALYVLTHGYEGRLGIEAINRRGLVNYVDGRYETDGARGWTTVSAGVDPPRLSDMEAVLREQLRSMGATPPAAAEIAEARQHLLGRSVTGVQSNEELAFELARQWMWLGRVRKPGDLARELAAVSDDDVRRAATDLSGSGIITVEAGDGGK